jgi:hypothetical protein
MDLRGEEVPYWMHKEPGLIVPMAAIVLALIPHIK